MVWNRRTVTWTAATVVSLLLMIATTQGFSNYLLSTSGCYVGLDTEEVIMNHLVLPPQINPPLKIVPIGLTPQPPSSEQQQQQAHTDPILVLVPEFPTTIKLRVEPTEHATKNFFNYGYEYVLQIDEDSNASFDRGSCAKSKRVAGQSRDEVQLHLRGEAIVWGAWAGNHEAVKLLQGYKFVSSLPPPAGEATQDL